ncbi:MAG: hypothetical protein DRI94_13360 [Bacteroidetes bacterium]|nr:MAG: hypothetical protein DRI94_13360 [Bacteroidota bacterium]
MNPASKYWLNNFFSDVKIKIGKYKNISDSRLYLLIAQTGILYDIPVKSIFYNKKKYTEWNNIELFKVIYIEVLTLISVNNLKTDNTSVIINKIYNFINIQNKQNDNIDHKITLIENYINNLFAQKTLKSKLLYNDSYNFTFIDFYLYYNFLKNNNLHNFQYQKEQYIGETLKFIDLFINKNNNVTKLENDIYKHYLDSAKNYIDHFDINKINKINKINYDLFDNNFIKRLIIDIAIIIFLEDSNIDDQEEKVLSDLINKFNVEDKYLQQSIIFVENFILENSGKIFYLNKRKLPYITKSLANRVSKLIKKNKNMIISEIRESGELLVLIQKSLKTELTIEEKQKINKQIKDIIKSIPALAIFMIPGGTIILPIILKILPNDLVYPSSFKNEKQINNDIKN